MGLVFISNNINNNYKRESSTDYSPLLKKPFSGKDHMLTLANKLFLESLGYKIINTHHVQKTST